MKSKKILKLLKVADKHQERLAKIHELLDEQSLTIHPSTAGNILTQIVDLSNIMTYVITENLSPSSLSSHPQTQPLHYTFSPEDLDAELEMLYDEDGSEDEDEEDDDETSDGAGAGR